MADTIDLYSDRGEFVNEIQSKGVKKIKNSDDRSEAKNRHAKDIFDLIKQQV